VDCLKLEVGANRAFRQMTQVSIPQRDYQGLGGSFLPLIQVYEEVMQKLNVGLATSYEKTYSEIIQYRGPRMLERSCDAKTFHAGITAIRRELKLLHSDISCIKSKNNLQKTEIRNLQRREIMLKEKIEYLIEENKNLSDQVVYLKENNKVLERENESLSEQVSELLCRVDPYSNNGRSVEDFFQGEGDD